MRLRHHLKDEELHFLEELLEVLYRQKGLGMGEEVMRWKGSSNGLFSVSSFYQLLSGEGDELFPWRDIWFTGLPPKVSFFVWTTAVNRILPLIILCDEGRC